MQITAMLTAMDDTYIYIYGTHAVEEALRMRPDVVAQLHLRDDVRTKFPEKLLSGIKSVQAFSGNNVPRGVDKHSVHQGMIA